MATDKSGNEYFDVGNIRITCIPKTWDNDKTGLRIQAYKSSGGLFQGAEIPIPNKATAYDFIKTVSQALEAGGLWFFLVASVRPNKNQDAMTIPYYQTCMLPLLRTVQDGNEWTMKEVTTKLSDEFGLSDDEREEMLPSGNSRVIVNRVGWAKSYLKEAGLVASIRWGVIKITDEGESVLTENPDNIDMEYLERFPSFMKFLDRKKATSKKKSTTEVVVETTASTPDDLIVQAYDELRDALAKEVLQQVKDMSDKFFERLVVELLVAMGYGGSIEDAGKAVGKSGDGGIDGVIKEDKLGLDVIVIQAKRWTTNSVSRPEIQSFAGSMEACRASKGVFITTSTFSTPAKEYVNKIQRKIVLVDGFMLANLMIDNGVGVSTFRTFDLKRLDLDFFQE